MEIVFYNNQICFRTKNDRNIPYCKIEKKLYNGPFDTAGGYLTWQELIEGGAKPTTLKYIKLHYSEVLSLLEEHESVLWKSPQSS